MRPLFLEAQERLVRHGVEPILARLYVARGVQSPEELASELTHMLPPDSLLNIKTAATLLADAIESKKRMVIVADYDCDGATACALGVRGLAMFGAKVNYIVPNRFEYGYGLTPEIVRLAHERFLPELLITVDNGIASVEGAREARRLGMELLITDHHLPGAELPDACIVNPNQPGCEFPSKNLAGVGVMFYVLIALRAEFRTRGAFEDRPQPRLETLLDLVALGTVADVVRLDANNRLLVAQGLKRLQAGRMQPGLAALFTAAGREARTASAFDLGFALGPRINAAGRLADMALGIECLVTDDPLRAGEIARQLDEMNRRRRDIETEMQEQAMAALGELEQSLLEEEKASLCLFDPGWHPGVVGILASRLKDRFNRPTIVFAPVGDGTLRGSGRSIAGLHLRDALDLVSKREPDVIVTFGGHAMAAGLTIAEDHFERFAAAFEDSVRHMIDPAMLTRTLEHDGPLTDREMNLATVRSIDGQVWGNGFAPPLFANRFRVGTQRLLKDQHLKLTLRNQEGSSFEAIWFRHTETLPGEVEVIYRLAADTYNGNQRVQLIVEHARGI